MKVMNAVWVLTGLWAGLLGLGAYILFGRQDDPAENRNANGSTPVAPGKPIPRWQAIALSTLHCGAGCTLADLTGEWFTAVVPISVGGSLIAGSWIFNYLLALVFGFWFQYLAIRSMGGLSAGRALNRAVKAGGYVRLDGPRLFRFLCRNASTQKFMDLLVHDAARQVRRFPALLPDNRMADSPRHQKSDVKKF